MRLDLSGHYNRLALILYAESPVLEFVKQIPWLPCKCTSTLCKVHISRIFYLSRSSEIIFYIIHFIMKIHFFAFVHIFLKAFHSY